jgi:hypothetical protein
VLAIVLSNAEKVSVLEELYCSLWRKTPATHPLNTDAIYCYLNDEAAGKK